MIKHPGTPRFEMLPGSAQGLSKAVGFGMGFEGLGFRISGFGFRVLGFRV